MASRRERITQLIPNPDAMRRRESTREWRYSQPDGNPNKRFRDDDDITKMRAKFPRVHLTQREKLRKRFGICEAFNKEIDKIKSHRIKLAISANGYPRQ
ncbi:hypothetical protein Pmar_PMAR019334 [Perkinsus marinus ATCC 50983]|uniref:Uncharacterized protein n=1 Tax=Perkinsus marinus (strain ATCC 50983 / TXsc) TaxID=423536 RepID=C5KFV1_PERM5|nr:hypothetical protein Pmar_PMAR019334 [Perkinsus marinus ATCC 50983]EER16653.1 hypothetical protein Pmar_PMAR019334 [Perkinsus marinus ATCC 50983]|eukprot:XP_002784857.1 hypothetical protein Pmar_PMAR019334 [Perkinsus marinus ATCC 50983]